MIRNKLLRTLTRTALVCLFPPSGIDKIIHWDDAMKQARSGPLPGAPFLLASSVVLETVAPIAIVSGKYDREAAAALAGFCAVTALMYHQFWRYDDLTAPGRSEGRDHMWECLKNFGLAGGLMYVAIGEKIVDDAPSEPRAAALDRQGEDAGAVQRSGLRIDLTAMRP